MAALRVYLRVQTAAGEPYDEAVAWWSEDDGEFLVRDGDGLTVPLTDYLGEAKQWADERDA